MSLRSKMLSIGWHFYFPFVQQKLKAQIICHKLWRNIFNVYYSSKLIIWLFSNRESQSSNTIMKLMTYHINSRVIVFLWKTSLSSNMSSAYKTWLNINLLYTSSQSVSISKIMSISKEFPRNETAVNGECVIFHQNKKMIRSITRRPFRRLDCKWCSCIAVSWNICQKTFLTKHSV